MRFRSFSRKRNVNTLVTVTVTETVRWHNANGRSSTHATSWICARWQACCGLLCSWVSACRRNSDLSPPSIIVFCYMTIQNTRSWLVLHASRDMYKYTNIDWCRGQHWKILPRSYVMLAEGRRPEGNTAQLRGKIFQCWSRLTVDICFVIL